MTTEVSTETQQRILDAARHIFVQKGRELSTMGDIAKEAGINRTALNYYFRSKDKLFDGVFEHVLKSFLPHIEKIIEADKPVLEKFRDIIEAHTDFLLDNPNLPYFVLTEMNRDPVQLLETMQDMNGPAILSKFAEQIEAEMHAGTVRRRPMIDIITAYAGLMFLPFLIKNILTLVYFPGTRDGLEQYVAQRKQMVFEAMRGLLEPEKKD